MREPRRAASPREARADIKDSTAANDELPSAPPTSLTVARWAARGAMRSRKATGGGRHDNATGGEDRTKPLGGDRTKPLEGDRITPLEVET
jgi:hypothetical protein